MNSWLKVTYSKLTTENKKKAKVKERNIHLAQEFRAACSENNLAKLRQIFAKGLDVNRHTTGSERCLLFHILCREHRWKTVSCLLDGGLNPSEYYDCLDSFGSILSRSFPLELACRAQDVDIVLLLLGRGADVNARGCYVDEVTEEEEGFTALTIACRQGNRRIVSALLSRGADVSTPERPGGITPLYRACQLPDADVVDQLLEAGAAVNINTQDESGRSPLGLVSLHHLDIALTLLQWAVKGGHRGENQGVVRYKHLMRHGWRPETRTVDGRSLLHQACADWDVLVVDDLLQRGWDINARTDNSWLPLHYISNPLSDSRFKPSESKVQKVLDLIGYLYCRGVDLNQTTTDGHTLLRMIRFSVGSRVKQFGTLILGMLQFPVIIHPIHTDELDVVSSPSLSHGDVLAVLIPLVLAGADDGFVLRTILRFALIHDDLDVFNMMMVVFPRYTTNYIIVHGCSSSLVIQNEQSNKRFLTLSSITSCMIRRRLFSCNQRCSVFYTLKKLPLPPAIKAMLGCRLYARTALRNNKV